MTLLMLTDRPGTILGTFHALSNLIIANILEIGTIFPICRRENRCTERLSNFQRPDSW